MAKKSFSSLNKEMAKAQQKLNAIRQELKEAKRQAFVAVGETACEQFPELLEREEYAAWFGAVDSLINAHTDEFYAFLGEKSVREEDDSEPVTVNAATSEDGGDTDA